MVTIVSFLGILIIHTFKKLPITIPNIKAITIKTNIITYLVNTRYFFNPSETASESFPVTEIVTIPDASTVAFIEEFFLNN